MGEGATSGTCAIYISLCDLGPSKALVKLLGNRPGPQLRLKSILVEILKRSLFWWETREKSSFPLISSASHLAFLSSFLTLLCHGYSYRYHMDEGLMLIVVPKAGKED